MGSTPAAARRVPPERRRSAVEIECRRRMIDPPERFRGVSMLNEKRAPVFEEAC